MSGFEIRRILVAIADPAAGNSKAIRRAAAIAHKTGAGIELFHAIPAVVSAGMAHADAEHFTRAEAQECRRRLERAANRLRREELIVTTHVQTGFPIHEAILRQVRLDKADLVVIEAHKHNVFARLLLTQTDFELIRHCPVPLLIVKGRAAWRSPRILAALDPFHRNERASALDGEIVDAARTLAAAFRGSVHAAHVYRPIAQALLGVPIGAVMIDSIEDQDHAYRTEVRRQFTAAVGGYGIPRGKTHLVCGDARTELPVLARSISAGLVVMGATSRSALKRIFIGNTAEHVLDSLGCDVLVVKASK